MKKTNWAQNILFKGEIKQPVTIEEVQEIISTNSKVRGIGSRHSFNEIAESSGVIIDSAFLPREIDIDSETRIVRVSSSVSYGFLGKVLEEHGLALENLGSLPHISVVGATATGTHGSGISNQNLSSAIIEGELILASGDKIVVSGDELEFFKVSLGSVGFIHHLNLRTVPSYEITQNVYLNLPSEILQEYLIEILSIGYSVSIFHVWGNKQINQIWVKSKEKSPSQLLINLGAKLATEKCHPVPGALTSSATEQMGMTSSWNESLPHFKFDQTPSLGEELQSEYFIPLEFGSQAIMELEQIADVIAPLLLISELRTIAEDQVALSPVFERTCIAIHFTWKHDALALKLILPEIERILKGFGARPHPGKVFTSSNFLFPGLYPKFDAFTAYRNHLDPKDKFMNRQLQSWGL